MPSEEADGKGEAMTGDAVVVAGAGAPAPPKSTSQQQPPAYAQAKNAYEALWKQHSDTRPLATQAPAGNAAASSSAPPEATAVNARPPAPAATAPSAPPLKLHAFQKLVGDEAFIPESSLTILKRIGAGSFATGEQRVLMTMEDSVLREDSVFVFFLDPLPILLPLPLPLPLPPACSMLHPFFPSPRKTRITLKKTVEVAEYTPHGSPAGTLPTRVAVKRLRRGSALDAVDLAHEARVLRGLSHKYITKYIGVGASQATRGKGEILDSGFGGGLTPKGGRMEPLLPLLVLLAAAANSTFLDPHPPSLSKKNVYNFPHPTQKKGGPLVDEHCYIVQAFVGGGTLKRIVAAQTEAKRASLTSAPPPQQQQHPSTSSPSSSSAPSPSKKHSPVGSIQCHYTHEDAARWGSQIAEGLAYLHGEFVGGVFLSFREREGEKKRVLKKGEREKKTCLFFHLFHSLP